MGQSPIPQYYSEANDAHEPIKGEDGAQNVRILDGHDQTQGSKADAKVVDPDVNATEIALLKGQLDRQNEALTTLTDILAKLNATLTTNTTVTNFPATQNVSGAVNATVTNLPATQDVRVTGSSATLPVKNVDGAGNELFTAANPANVTLQASAASGAAVPSKIVQVGGVNSGNLYALTLDSANRLIMTMPLIEGTAGQAAPTKFLMLGATDGTNAQALKVDAQKNLLVGLRGSDGLEPKITTWGTDGLGLSNRNGLAAQSLLYASNGTTADMWRNNTEGTLLASAARTATPPSSTMTNYNHRGLDLQFRVTAVTGSPSLTLSVQTQDADGNWVSIASFTAVTAVGVYSYQIYPGAQSSASYTSVRGTALPRTWRVLVTHGTADSVTYSLKYALIV
jgi:hypothetical protein